MWCAPLLLLVLLLAGCRDGTSARATPPATPVPAATPPPAATGSAAARPAAPSPATAPPDATSPVAPPPVATPPAPSAPSGGSATPDASTRGRTPLASLYDQLVRLWRLPAGRSRMTSTCAAHAGLQAALARVSTERRPHGVPEDRWFDIVAELEGLLDQTGNACQGPLDEFEVALSELHDRLDELLLDLSGD